MSKEILIVDDEPDVVVPIQFLMEQQGYNVIIAQNGEEDVVFVEPIIKQHEFLNRFNDLGLSDIRIIIRNGTAISAEPKPATPRTRYAKNNTETGNSNDRKVVASSP